MRKVLIVLATMIVHAPFAVSAKQYRLPIGSGVEPKRIERSMVTSGDTAGFDSGGNVMIPVSGVLRIALDVRDSSNSIRYSVGIGTVTNEANFFSYQEHWRQNGFVVLQKNYAVPEYQKAVGITSGLLTLTMTDGYAVFNILDGYEVAISSPPPKALDAFRIFTSPIRIANMVRTDARVEVTVEGKAGATVLLEVSENLREWRPAEVGAWAALTGSGQARLFHQSVAPRSFYRVRQLDGGP